MNAQIRIEIIVTISIFVHDPVLIKSTQQPNSAYIRQFRLSHLHVIHVRFLIFYLVLLLHLP